MMTRNTEIGGHDDGTCFRGPTSFRNYLISRYFIDGHNVNDGTLVGGLMSCRIYLIVGMVPWIAEIGGHDDGTCFGGPTSFRNYLIFSHFTQTGEGDDHTTQYSTRTFIDPLDLLLVGWCVGKIFCVSEASVCAVNEERGNGES